MSDFLNQIVRRQYCAHNGDDLLSQVQKVVSVIAPNCFISAGFHPSGEVLVVNSSQLDGPEWRVEFFEHELLNDPLLAAPEMIKSVFVAGAKSMLIPDELFADAAGAEQWLRAAHHVEGDEHVSVHAMDKSKMNICYSFPDGIRQMFAKYTKELEILPLNIIHFKNSIAAENLLQCTVSGNCAIATLHSAKKLMWHQTFDYKSPEDIAYKLAAAAQHFAIDVQQFPVSINVTGIEQNPVLRKLQKYFPEVSTRKMGISDILSPEWSSSVHLFQQLYACAS